MMWEKSGGITDLHSHLIPGVDDGARTIEDSMEGIGRLWEARSEKRGLFVVVEKTVGGKDMRAQMAGRIGAA